jgi:hypothetical protein
MVFVEKKMRVAEPIRYGADGTAPRLGTFPRTGNTPMRFHWIWLAAAAMGLFPARAYAQSSWLDVDPWWTSGPLFRAQASPYDEPLVTDRPDFTEASSTVGLGVLQIESGYTFTYDDDDGRFHGHSGPEALFRYGIADIVEFRLVWNYAWEVSREGGQDVVTDGADDLIIGTKIDMTNQGVWMPESALVIHLPLPTGARAFSSRHADIQFNYLYSWELSECFTLAGSSGYSTTAELTTIGPNEVLDRHNVFHQSVTGALSLTETLGWYTEFFGLYSDGRVVDAPENYLNGGFTYLLNNDVQFDIRAGVGLNEAADDFFGGAGVSLRL